MPSPFPGMDPYLEFPPRWSNVHHELISGIRAALNRQLRPRYAVQIEERVYLADDTDSLHAWAVPDLYVTRRSGLPVPAVLDGLTVAEPQVVMTMAYDELREARVEILDMADRQVVTVIEVLSPSNKTPGSHGQASYLQKRDEVLRAASHLVEIDLLRRGDVGGLHECAGACDYAVHVSRAERRPKGMVWPIQIRQRLPVIGIPLRNNDEETPLDLQTVLENAYDRAGFDLNIDYAKPPDPPLPSELAAWAEQLLRDKGVRME